MHARESHQIARGQYEEVIDIRVGSEASEVNADLSERHANRLFISGKYIFELFIHHKIFLLYHHM
jgi:hypothetical protein